MNPIGTIVTHNTRAAVKPYTSRDIKDQELASLWAEYHRMRGNFERAMDRVQVLETCVEQLSEKLAYLEAGLGIVQLCDSMDSASTDEKMSDEK